MPTQALSTQGTHADAYLSPTYPLRVGSAKRKVGAGKEMYVYMYMYSVYYMYIMYVVRLCYKQCTCSGTTLGTLCK